MTGSIVKLEAREDTRSRSLRSVPADTAAVNEAFRRGVVLPVGTKDGKTTVSLPNEAARTRGGRDMMRGSQTTVDVSDMFILLLKD